MKKADFHKWIIYEDADYLAVNKPSFISTLADRNDETHLLAIAKSHYSDAQVCHRLDKETSGVLVLSKHNEAYRHLAMQFEHRQVDKLYHAVVDGLHAFQNETIELAIKKLSDGTVIIARDGKEASTSFTTLQAYKKHTLVACRPITGRMHQIRIHLSSLMAPITGDQIYGGKPAFLSDIKRKFNLKKNEEEQPLIKRVALHAFELEFAGLRGKKVCVNAPYSKDFQALIRQLSANLR